MTSLTFTQRAVKRGFDLLICIPSLILFLPLISLLLLLASIDTKSFGLFFQQRVGRHGRIFWVVKLKTMRGLDGANSSIASMNSSRVTAFGGFCRKWKLDELPQLYNVVIGDMSLVGPRPDVPGYADVLTGSDRLHLSVRPGITGPASLKYQREEDLLNASIDPKKFNDEVIWPDKVRINLDYIRNWSLSKDLKYIINTVFK